MGGMLCSSHGTVLFLAVSFSIVGCLYQHVPEWLARLYHVDHDRGTPSCVLLDRHRYSVVYHMTSVKRASLGLARV
jgi:hypothetical protein